MSLNTNTQELNTILDTMNNLPLGGGGVRAIDEMIDESGVLELPQADMIDPVPED